MSLAEGLRRATAWVAERFEEGLSAVERPTVTRAPDLGTVIDVSQFQGAIDWAAVRASGVEAVWIRAEIGYGTGDGMVEHHAEGARVAGLPFGVYGLCYPRHGCAQDADRQARQLLEHHRQLGASLLPMIDVEDGPPGPPTHAEWAEAIDAYAVTIEGDLGKAPIVYGSPAFFATMADLLSLHAVDRCPLFVADYRPGPPQIPPPFTAYALHQFTGSGTCPGIAGAVDRSRLAPNVTIDVLRC